VFLSECYVIKKDVAAEELRIERINTVTSRRAPFHSCGLLYYLFSVKADLRSNRRHAALDHLQDGGGNKKKWRELWGHKSNIMNCPVTAAIYVRSLCRNTHAKNRRIVNFRPAA